ncbi:PAS domain S-box protein [Nostocaceae cyanobacterium CENA357]|uniref:Circadian input-output histidine kinase CikA n=1 Tax=Atlanticothrix silvestris CENA357 TaxID=1725252 RepID=A0A8J7HJU0_9CYAN|nr:PAS domain S-box protein [Atlanticothrix silvestris]MBH8553863.1 PAS domain S-box protein [Atlanticothrix silvestris CENA357]
MKRDVNGKFVSNWDSETKKRVSISLTNTAWRSLDEEAQKRGISRSEVIEHFARSLGNETGTNAENALLQAQIIEQQQEIANLQRQKQELSALLENAPDAIARFDSQIRYLYANRVAEQALGFSRDALLGKSMSEFMSDPIYLFWEEHLRQVLATAQQQEIEFEFETPFGVRFYQARLVPELDAEETPVSVVVISRDITETRQAQQQYTQLITTQETERQVAMILESITDAFVAFDRNWCYTYINQAAAAILHKTPEELLGKHVWNEVFPELLGGVAYQKLHQAITEQVSVAWEEFGEPVQRWLEIRAYPSAEGVAVYFRDITKRKQAEAEQERLLYELETERTRFEAVLRQMPAGVMIADAASGKLVLANEQAKQIVGYSYEQLLKLEDYKLIIPFEAFRSDGQIYTADEYPLARSLQTGEVVYNEEIELHQNDGSQILINVNSAPILNHQNQIVAAVVIFEDITERKQIEAERSRAEEALRESEARLQLALKVGRMGIWNWDMQTGKILWSENHFTILGLQVNEREPSYKLWADQVHPDDLATTKAKIKEAIAEKKEYHHEYRLRWSDNSIHWVEVRGHFTYDSQGNPQHSTGAVIDITERKQAEQEREQLLEREYIARTQAEAAQRQLTNIFETSPVGIALLDAQQRFIAINEALAQINGLTREQHLWHSIPEIFGQSDPQLVAVFDDIYTTGNSFISPNFAVNVPGRSHRSPGYYNVYYLPTINSNHQVEDVLIYVLDVTERVRLEQGQRFLSEASAVLSSSLDYQTTLEQIAQLIVPELADWCTVHIVEEDGSIEQITVAHIDPAKLQWAQQISRKYPLDPDAVRGAALTLRTGESDILPHIPDELLVQAARDSEHLEILRQVGFKSVITVPLRTQARILGVISFISAESGRQYDSTDLQLAEELARRASLAIDNAQLYWVAQRDRTKAESANRVKDEFLAVLSHELRSPLNPILGWTKMLRSKRLDAAKTDQALETIERNVKLQAQLIEDLLDVSRILQGKMTLNVAPVNLAATIAAALETVRLAADAKSIQIKTNLNSVSGTVSGDMNRLQQVIWNLLSNAVKFTPSGGRVEVQLRQVGMYAQIQVKDTGKGINPEFLPYVFEYFRQEDGTTTRQFGGLGLGLAIVRHFTELHGGTVEASSPGLNLGATFTVRLPLNVTEQQLLSDDSDLETVTDLAGIRILVVDDDADIRELSAFILTQAGAQVTTAASAVQALVLLNQSVPDLLLCDIGMPEMDGYALIRQIRKWSHKQGGTLPAIALTAYAGEINQQQALTAGFQMHIPKPVEPEMLMQAIVQLLHPIEQNKSLASDNSDC